MSETSFETFCAGLSKLTGSSLPPLTRNNQGCVTLGVKCEGIDAWIAHGPRWGDDVVTAVVDFGSAPPPQEFARYRELLQANFQLLGSRHHAAFGRDPLTRMLALQMEFSLSTLTPHELMAELHEIAPLVQKWKGAHRGGADPQAEKFKNTQGDIRVIQ